MELIKNKNNVNILNIFHFNNFFKYNKLIDLKFFNSLLLIKFFLFNIILIIKISLK